jgi:hypothetical protein
MAKNFKWVFLSIVCAVAAIFLYTTIDSEWSVKTNSSIWLTILFFASATLAILFAFSAVEGKEEEAADNNSKPSLPEQTTKAMHVKKLGGLTS